MRKNKKVLSFVLALLFGGLFYFYDNVGLHFPFDFTASVPAQWQEQGPSNFQEAKRIAREIFSDHPETFYCGCKIFKGNKIDLNSCGYQINQDPQRANRVEWEHIVPISHLAGHLPCWRNKLCCKEDGTCFKGRSCCQQLDPAFSKMEADLHNLVPEIGELNALRSNFRFGILPAVPSGQFGVCAVKIDPETRRIEPREENRGFIARTYPYMSEKYSMHLSASQRQLFIAWNNQYPPDDWELTWDKRVSTVQGNSNPYISQYTKR